MSRRTEMLGSTIRRELAEMILRDLDDPRLVGLPTITRVKVSSDLSIADVFITVMGTPGQQNTALNALRHSAGMMRSRLTSALSTRITPFLKFHLDDQLAKELGVLEALHKVELERAELERQRAGQSSEPAAGETIEHENEQPTEPKDLQ